jgi:hypothetical protein
MLQNLILIDSLSSACWEKKKKKKIEKRSSWGLFSQGRRLAMPCWLCRAGFLWLLSAVKG